jgi:hypothetical protein
MAMIVMGAQGASITLVSNSTANDPNQFNSVGPNVVITPNVAWETNLGPWISFAQTGQNGIVVPNSPLSGPPTATYYDDFTIPGTASAATITVGADDTTSFSVNGTLLASPNPNELVNCTQTIGCLSNTEETFNILPYLSIGQNVITLGEYQLFGDSSGVTYSGTVTYTPSPTPTPTPETGTGILFGSGLLLVSIGAHRRRRHLQPATV